MSPERKLFLDRLSLRNLSPRTVENHMHTLIKATKFHNKSPLKMDSREIEAFLLHELKVEKLLGHANIKTTMIYLHGGNIVIAAMANPLDVLKG
jgi:integrase